MNTLTRHYQKLAEKLSRELLMLEEQYKLLEQKQYFKRPDGTVVDESGNEIDPNSPEGQSAQPFLPTPTGTQPGTAPAPPPPAQPTPVAPAPPPPAQPTPATPTSPQAGVGQVINTGTPEAATASAVSKAYSWNPQKSGLSNSMYSTGGGNVSDWDSYALARRAAEYKRRLGREAARAKASDEMRDLDAKSKSAGLSPDEEARLDFLRTRYKQGHVGRAVRDRMREANKRSREREQKARENAQTVADVKAAQTNTAPPNVRTPKGETPWSIGKGEPGSPGVEPVPEPPPSPFMPDIVPGPLNPDGTERTPPTPQPTQPFYPTPTGEAPKPQPTGVAQTTGTQTSQPPATGGQVTATAQNMNATPAPAPQTGGEFRVDREPPTPPPTAPVASQRPGPGGMSTQPVGSTVTAPTRPAATTAAPASRTGTTSPEEQQGTGPAEKDRGVPTPIANPYASRQRGRVVTRAAATMSPRVAASTRTA